MTRRSGDKRRLLPARDRSGALGVRYTVQNDDAIRSRRECPEVSSAAGSAMAAHSSTRPGPSNPRCRRSWRTAGRSRSAITGIMGRTTSRSFSRSRRAIAAMPAYYRQPLLAGSGVDFTRVAGPIVKDSSRNVVDRRGVLIARINTDVTLADFELNVTNLVPRCRGSLLGTLSCLPHL